MNTEPTNRVILNALESLQAAIAQLEKKLDDMRITQERVENCKIQTLSIAESARTKTPLSEGGAKAAKTTKTPNIDAWVAQQFKQNQQQRVYRAVPGDVESQKVLTDWKNTAEYKEANDAPNSGTKEGDAARAKLGKACYKFFNTSKAKKTIIKALKDIRDAEYQPTAVQDTASIASHENETYEEDAYEIKTSDDGDM